MSESKVQEPVQEQQAVTPEALLPAAGYTIPSDAALLVEAQETVPDPDTIVLELVDLLPDASGEVVLFAEEHFPVNILAHEGITEAGVSEAHVTATGVDVTGLHFYSFEGGLTLYSSANVHVINEIDFG